MENKSVETKRCSRCGKYLPVIDENGRPNFCTEGGGGFGQETKHICIVCKANKDGARPPGWGS